jgi:hypothetical protein
MIPPYMIDDADGRCRECGGPPDQHQTDRITAENPDGSIHFSLTYAHPRRRTHEMRQVGDVLRIPSRVPPKDVIQSAAKFVASGLMGLSPVTYSVHVVQPGGHDDPLGETWVVGWKAMARYSL